MEETLNEIEILVLSLLYECLELSSETKQCLFVLSELEPPPKKGHDLHKANENCTYYELIQNKTLHGGLDAGLFTLHGDVKTINDCTNYCCNDEHCDIAFLVDDACYSVQCKDKKSCTPVEAPLSKTKVSLALISRGNRQPITDENGEKFLSRPVEKFPEQVSWFCKGSNISKVFTNVQLRYGLQAGNVTNKGVVTNYHQCVGYCCQDKHCNVAVTLGYNCLLVACKTYASCLPEEALDKDYHSQVIYVNWEIPSEKILTKGKILYKNLGCWHEDERSKSLMSLEGSDDILMDSYKSRRNAIAKCAMVARKRNFKVFALHDGGECRSGHSTQNIYQSHGRSHGCHKGVGDLVSNHVYHIKENGSVADHGCWKAIQREENFATLESTDGRVKEKYKERNDSLLKCAEAAMSNQYTLFALRDGGQCLAGNVESTTYKKHGVSKLCANGLGSSSSKNVYQIIGTTQLSLEQRNKKPFLTRNAKKRQDAKQKKFVQSKLPSLQLPFMHSSPQSRVFTYGFQAGHFTHQGKVSNMAECIQYCGQQPNCSAAFMVRQFCFTVKCYNKRSCDTAPAVNSGYNPKVAFITHLSPAMTSYKEKEETKLFQSRPFASTFQKDQHKVNKSIRAGPSKLLPSKNLSPIPYNHSPPQSRVFIHGLQAGHFTHQGKANNMAECIQYCGQQPNCSAAFMVRQFCFTVKCYNKRSCDTAPAVDPGYNPKVAFITHLSPPVTSQPEQVPSRRCEGSKIYENVTLFGGVNAGNFTDFGPKKNMSHCISSCCQQKHCDVAFMLGNDCYGVKCKTKHLCGTTPAKHVKKYRPRLAYMHSNIEHNIADSQSLSSCWNGKTLVNYTLTGGIDAGIFYSNGNTDTMTTCMKYCCEQHDCDLAFRIDQGCYTVHCKDQKQCQVRKARKTRFLPEIAFKRPEIAMDEALTNKISKKQHGTCQIGKTHFNATLKMGMHSGKFNKLGWVDNMEDCVEMCCRENDIDAAFMLGKLCYSVKCYNSNLCQIRPAYISSINMLNVNPAVTFIHNNNNRKDYTRSEIERRCEGTIIKENTTLLGQVDKETFIDYGERSNIQDCISACCNSPSCDIALMNGKRCFSVQCGRNATNCQEVRADSSLSTSTLAHVTRYMDAEHEQELELSASSSQCPQESLNELRVYKNKTLLGGFETGNYTFLGRMNKMQQCIQKCCSMGKCDVAYSIDGNCYGIECFSENLCHVDNEVPDTTKTEISIIKDIKLKQSRRLSRLILPVLSLLLAVLIIIASLSWIRSRKILSSKN